MEKTSKALKPCYLCVQVLSGILSRIPVRSLVQWRCVSKTWRALIDDPVFARLHLTHSNNTCDETRLFVVQKTSRGRECVVRCSKTLSTIANLAIIEAFPHSIPTLPIDDGMWDYCSSVDGLIMLVATDSIYGLMLWNPSIRKARRVPPCPEISIEMMSAHFGLGFDSSSQDYKHVIFVHDLEQNLRFFAIYSVGSNSWKTTEFREESVGGYPFGLAPDCGSAVCVGGVLYDLPGTSFDLRTETLSIVSHPKDPKLLFCCEALTTADCGRLLALVQFTYFNVYVLVLQHGVWTQRYKFPAVAPECGLALWDAPFLLYLMNNGEVLLNWGTVLTSYCIESGEQRILLEEKLKSPVVRLYKESLLLLN